MNVHYLRIARKYLPTFRYGIHRVSYIHIGTSNRGIIRTLRGTLAHDGKSPAQREARKAYYIGGIIGMRRWRKICAAWRM